MESYNPSFQNPINEEEHRSVDVTTNSKIYSKVFLYFGLALLITGAVSMLMSALLFNFNMSPVVYYVLTGISSIGLLVLSFVISFKGYSMGNGLIAPYILYAVFMGVLLTGCSLWVGSPYIFGLVLLVTSALFLFMCGLGLLIGKHVGMLWTLLIAGLIGAGVMGLVSFFAFPFMFAGDMASLIPMMYVGEFSFLFIMLLYVAIDMYALKRVAQSNTLVSTNMCLFFALRLYSDFISILIRVLRIVALAMANKDN